VKLPCLAQQLVAGPPEDEFSVAAKKPTNSREGAEYLLETAVSNEMRLRTNSVAPAEPLQQRHNDLVGDGSSRNSDQAATLDKLVNASQEIMQQTPPYEVFQSDNVVLQEELV
jgi:hypothetical protein